MKIGFLINYFYPRKGGAENNCFYLARELTKNHEVHVFTSLLKGTKKYEIIDNIHIHRYKTLFRYRYYLSFTPGLIDILKYELDILHVHSFGFVYHDLILMLKKILSTTKIINTPHGPFMVLKYYNYFQKLFKAVVGNFERRIANKFYDAVIQVNLEQYKWLTKYGIKKNKIHFAPNGILQDSFKKIKNKDFTKKYNLENKFVISYLGRIQRYKGLDQVIKIIPRLNKNVVFLIIGKDAGDESRLKSLASNLRIRDRIIFTGEISDEEVIKGLSVSKIFILPSEWEAFGISILQAMARGNTIISTRTEGGRFLVKENENGFLFNYNDLKDLENKVKVLVTDKQALSKISKINKEKAKQFLWENIVKDLEKVYNKIIIY
ncbi:MAG: glycosyltransferase family 4 protein [Nanoarchaeota archaeon]